MKKLAVLLALGFVSCGTGTAAPAPPLAYSVTPMIELLTPPGECRVIGQLIRCVNKSGTAVECLSKPRDPVIRCRLAGESA